MRRIALTLFAAAALGLVACGSLDAPDRVHDLRLLAIRAEPPEQVFPVPVALDGGLPSDLAGTDGGAINPAVLLLLATQVQPVTITALVADPDGGGRPVHYAWASCAELSDNRCKPGSAGYVALGEGDAPPDGGWEEIALTFRPSAELLLTALQKDPYGGFGGLPLPVQLSLKAGDEETVGFKRVIFTLAFADQPLPVPNHNPYVPLVLLDGEPWSETVAPVFGDRRPRNVNPVVVSDAEEPYTHSTFEGGQLQFRERWRYNFYATAGTFSSFNTGGTNNFSGDANAVDSDWKPRDEDAAQDLTYFIVVRDGRGGEGWTVRHARFEPPQR